MTNGPATMPTTTAPRWWEAAGGMHSLVQIVWALGIVISVMVGWLLRVEVRGAQTEDHFAASEARKPERAAERAEFRRDLDSFHNDLIDLRVMVTRLDTRIDDMTGRMNTRIDDMRGKK